MRKRSFARRNRAFSVAKSAPAGEITACVWERRGDPPEPAEGPPRHPCSARRAAAQRQSPAPRQFTLTSPFAPPANRKNGGRAARAAAGVAILSYRFKMSYFTRLVEKTLANTREREGVAAT
jgi:hypothetical protein